MAEATAGAALARGLCGYSGSFVGGGGGFGGGHIGGFGGAFARAYHGGGAYRGGAYGGGGYGGGYYGYACEPWQAAVGLCPSGY